MLLVPLYLAPLPFSFLVLNYIYWLVFKSLLHSIFLEVIFSYTLCSDAFRSEE